jgi:predicted transcriptional regulator of viral defense system
MDSVMAKAHKLVQQRSVIRSKDFDADGIPRSYLRRLVLAGKLERVAKGIYSSPSVDATEHRTLVEVARKAPHAIICLLSALRFHNLTTQSPFEVWIALRRGAWRPKSGYPPLRVAWLSGLALNFGIEEHRVEGTRIRVYSPAKTVADCFKFRSKVGLDVALQALRECYREKRATIDQLWEAAKVCRMANVMRPYIESLVQ